MNTKQTPRTDAQTGEHSTFHGVQMVSADFARQLETQVNELREALEAYVSKDFEMGGTSSKAEIHNVRLAVSRATLERTK